MIWCILIPLIVGIICAILGYLLGKISKKCNYDDYELKIKKLKEELEACKKSKQDLHNDLEKTKSALTTCNIDLDACRNNKISLEADLKDTKASLASSLAINSAAAILPFSADVAKAVFGKKIKQDDLKIVEGIGPKIEQLFHNHDIKTWKALSECSLEKCKEVLLSGGDRFKLHKPGTWPKQAKLAYEGEWEALLKWQDELDGGR